MAKFLNPVIEGLLIIPKEWHTGWPNKWAILIFPFVLLVQILFATLVGIFSGFMILCNTDCCDDEYSQSHHKNGLRTTNYSGEDLHQRLLGKIILFIGLIFVGVLVALPVGIALLISKRCYTLACKEVGAPKKDSNDQEKSKLKYDNEQYNSEESYGSDMGSGSKFHYKKT